ncbi:P-loop containing nucleoside triphosphate hydrolase protein [Pisolithus microcarpus]|nr:P-loop containing nucleoside triphosphate hydrolase protein [Pisolithus microcarpus]
MIEANLCDELSQAMVLDPSTSKFPTFPPSLFTSFDFMSHSPALSDLPVEDDWDPRVDQAMGHSELGIAVRSGALMQPTLSSNAVLPKGTPSAIGALRLHKSAVFQSYSTPFRNHNLNLVSPQINSTPTKVVNEEGSDTELEREEANFVLEAVHAQCNVCILEQQLAAVKVDETIALGNLYQFRAQTAEQWHHIAQPMQASLSFFHRKHSRMYCEHRRYQHPQTAGIESSQIYRKARWAMNLVKVEVQELWKLCADLYDTYISSNADSVLHKYAAEYWDTSPGKSRLHPHVFQLASNAYYHMRCTAQDQSILFSGETTRGKSENRRLAIKTFLKFSVLNPRKKESLLFPLGKRNFHIFYYLIAGPSPEHSAGARPNAIRADDAHQFEQLKVALKTVGLSKQHAIQACQVVAAILHLGNLKFTIDHSRDVDATVMHNVDTLALVAESLGVQPSALENTLSYKTKLVKKELFTVFLDSDGASDNRNDLAKTLYSLLFTWLNKHINQCLCRDDFNTFISLFDLPGPQNMTGRSNSLDHNVSLNHMSMNTNLRNRPGGLIHIVDDQAHWSHKKTDHMMVEAFTKRSGNHSSFKLGGGLDRSGFLMFTICLFNGPVTYSSEAFLERNLDALNSDFTALLRGMAVGTGVVDGGEGAGSINPFVQAPTITEEEREDEDIAMPQNTGTPCIAGEFCAALDTLFDTLGDTQNCSRNDRSRDRFAVQGWSRLPSGGSNVQGGRDGTLAEQIERMRVALGLGETDVVLGQHKVFLSQATFHAMEDYLHAADVEEQKHNWMHEAEVEAVSMFDLAVIHTPII